MSGPGREEKAAARGARRNDVPVLMLHAAGLDARSAGFLDIPGTVAVTLPGHGERVRLRPGLTLADMADEVVGWTDGPMDVVGLSMGGMVAQHLALACPARVRSLVLACTTARTDTEVMLARAEATEAADAEETVRLTLDRWFTAEALGRDPLPSPIEYARSCLRTIDSAAFAAVWRAIAGHDVLDRLGEITVPTTCIAGTRDVSTPPDVVATIAAGLPHARMVEIDAPHMASLEQPELFRDAVLEHLAWVDRSGPSPQAVPAH